MARFVLLLRGVNVGKGNALPMTELRHMLARVSCTDVATYVQSGNAVLSTSLGAGAFTRAIETELARYMGRPIATTVRTTAALRRIVADNPFPEASQDPTHVCVTFFSRRSRPAELGPLTTQRWDPDRLHVAGTELYSLHPNGQGRSPLAAAISRLKFDGTVTTRNWRTVEQLLVLAEG